MKRTENKLFGDQVRIALHDLLEDEILQKIFLSLMMQAKESAYQNLLKKSQDFKMADDRAHELYNELWDKKGLKNCSLFNEYIDAADLADTIWAEEMYLRGIQDAVSFFMLTSKPNVMEATGFSKLD